MKTILLFFLALLISVLGGLCIIYYALSKANELNKDTCEKCDFCDPTLQHCWMKGISVGLRDPACVTFKKREDETES